MTVSNTNSYLDYTVANTSLSTYAYNFRIISDEDMQVWLRPSATSTTETQLVEIVHFAVQDVGENTGGNVIFTSTATALADFKVGATLRLVRNIDITQPVDYIENDTFPAQTQEDALDRGVMISQQLDLANEKYLWIDSAFSTATITEVERAANGYLRWAPDGVGIDAVFNVEGVPVSPWYANQVTATTQYLAQVGLGVPGLANDATITGYWNFTAATTEFTLVSSTLIIGSKGSFTNGSFDHIYSNTFNIGTVTGTNASFDTIVGNLVSATKGSFTNVSATNILATNGTFGTLDVTGITTLATVIGTYASFTTSKGSDRGLIQDLIPTYSSAGTLALTSGYVDIAGLIYTLPATIEFAAPATKDYIGYIYVSATASGVTLATSNFSISGSSPTYSNSNHGYYSGADRCIGHSYTAATDTLAPFHFWNDRYSFDTPVPVITDVTATAATIYNQLATAKAPSLTPGDCQLQLVASCAYPIDGSWTADEHKLSMHATDINDTTTTSVALRTNAQFYQIGRDNEWMNQGATYQRTHSNSSKQFRFVAWTNRTAGNPATFNVAQKWVEYPIGLKRG